MNTSIYSFDDYKKFIHAWLETLPRKGYGESRKIAEHLGVSTTMISQIFNGEKHLSLEMAAELAEYLGLSGDETAHFYLLVQYQRAGSHKLRKSLLEKIKETQKRVQELEKRIKAKDGFPSEVINEFYSSWAYAGTWGLIALEQYHSPEALAERLHLPVAKVKRILDFFLREKMAEYADGKLRLTSASVHIGKGSPFLTKHHTNWRLRAVDQLTYHDRASDLFFSGPLHLSQELADQIREELPAFIESIIKRVVPSPSEVVRCLNIDWFDY